MATVLEAFCQKHQISVRRFASICGDTSAGIGKSAAHKLIRGTADPTYVERMLPHIVLSLASFLLAKGVSGDEVSADIRAAFPEMNPLKAPHSATLIIRNSEGRMVSVHEYNL